MRVEVKLPLTNALISVTVVCLALPSLLAQRYSFKRYDQESGLPDQSIRTLLQDRTGFLWIATDNGLFRYDGHRFRGYTQEDGLPASQVEALYQTTDGTIWAATIPGLARLKGERFEAVDISGKRGAGALVSDSWGRLYVGTWSGLVVLGSPASSKPDLRLYPMPSGEPSPVRAVAISPSGAVWFTCGRQLCRLEAEQVVSRTEWGVPDDVWQAIQIDPGGTVWARSRTRLIALPAGETRFHIRDSGLPPSATRGTLLVDREGRLWVPTLRGLARRTPGGWDIVGKTRGLPMSSVQCAYQDREGSIWIGLNGGGLVRWLGYPYWEQWTEAEGLSSESVWRSSGIKTGSCGPPATPASAASMRLDSAGKTSRCQGLVRP